MGGGSGKTAIGFEAKKFNNSRNERKEFKNRQKTLKPKKMGDVVDSKKPSTFLNENENDDYQYEYESRDDFICQNFLTTNTSSDKGKNEETKKEDEDEYKYEDREEQPKDNEGEDDYNYEYEDREEHPVEK